MKEYLNSDSLFSTLLMLLADSPNLILVVEGDDDALLLKRHATSLLTVLPGAGGRPSVIGAARTAERQGLNRVRFLVDKDFDEPRELREGLSNLIVSQGHDLFTDLMSADRGALEEVVAVALRSARRRPPGDKRQREIPEDAEVIQSALRLAAPVTAVRAADRELRLGVNFTRFSFAELSGDSPRVDAVVAVLVQRQCLPPDEEAQLSTMALRLLPCIASDVIAFAGDHDIFSALSRCMSRARVTRAPDRLQEAFLLAVRCRSLSALSWFPTIEVWCDDHGLTGFDCRAAA